MEWSAGEMEEHLNSVREAVASFIKKSGDKFSDLVDHINSEVQFGIRIADEQMFKAWTEKEFPGQLTYSYSQTETYDGEDENEDDLD